MFNSADGPFWIRQYGDRHYAKSLRHKEDWMSGFEHLCFGVGICHQLHDRSHSTEKNWKVECLCTKKVNFRIFPVDAGSAPRSLAAALNQCSFTNRYPSV